MKKNLKSLLSFLFLYLFIATFFLNKAAALGCIAAHEAAGVVVECLKYNSNAFSHCVADTVGSMEICYGTGYGIGCRDPSASEGMSLDPLCYCCWDDREVCPSPFECVASSQCNAGGEESNYRCDAMVNGTVCCSDPKEFDCDCIQQEDHFCYRIPPVNREFKFTPKPEFSCGDCAPGLNYTCYYKYKLSEGVCGNGSRCLLESTCTQNGFPSLGQMDCDNGKLCCQIDKPVSAVYRGPIIDRIEKIINPAVKMLYYGGLAIGVFFVILAGYSLMTSEGDPQRTKAAQEQLTAAIVGIIFILLSVTILRVIIDEIIQM